MNSDFDQSLKWVLADEGGNDDDPVDPGGRTSRGITQKEYNAWRSLKGLPHRDVWTADQSEIDTIYHDQYWEPWGDKLPIGVDYLYFDMNVNMGAHEATLLLQRAAGVAADGHLGLVSFAAINQASPSRIIIRVSEEKVAFYKSLRTFWKYGKGWLARVQHVETRALHLAVGGIQSAPTA